MKIRRFTGKDMREALRLVKEELGADAVIMSNKKTANGIELVAAYDKEPQGNHTASTRSVNNPTGQNTDETAPRILTPQNNTRNTASTSVRPSPTLNEIIGDSGQDNLQALLEKQMAKTNGSAQTIHQQTQMDQHSQALQANVKEHHTPAKGPKSLAEMSAEQAALQTTQAAQLANSSTATTSADITDIAEIKAELNALRSVLTHQVAGLVQQDKQRQNPVKHFLCHELQKMGINAPLAEQLMTFVPDTSNERQAWMFVLKLLANRLRIAGHDITQEGGVVALVGPTGTGKTTTVAKLAAQFAKQHGADSVAMVTIDNYRIAAYEQLATYGKIIGCQVKKAQSSQELADILFQMRHKKLVLIDSAGFSQRDVRLINQLSTFENVTNMPIKKYLVTQASAQYQVLQRIIAAYQGIELAGCIMTKTDECYSLGEVLSVAIENDLPLSYVTNGQKVPEDIAIAGAEKIVAEAAKLYKKYSVNYTKGMHTQHAARAI